MVGAWRSKIQFSEGAFAAIKDLEFLYVLNAGGTMTESSNYDGAPPVAPAYGVWRVTGSDEAEATYTYFNSRPPAKVEELIGGGGWLPAGHGVLREHMTFSPDRQSFESTLTLELFDVTGKPIAGGGKARGRGVRLGS
jgi:hypothetical protein